jgi:hypothetical protein
MSPTVLRIKNYRFHFWSLEEPRMHVHVSAPDGIAKFWLEPIVALDESKGLREHQLRELQRIVEEHRYEIIKAWKSFFKS